MRFRQKISLLGMSLAASAALAVGPGSGVASAAPAPSTSPSVSHRYYSDAGGIPPCATGYVCTIVAYGSGYYVFNFYDYGTYYLSNWLNWGGITNEQTGGAAARLYNANGHQTACLPPEDITGEVNWDPIWKIKLTARGC